MHFTENPLVSIVLPVYNGQDFLSQQLDSLLVQTYSNTEIILVDDCSTDNSYSILESYHAKYPEIQIHRNDQNLGYNRNFEKAVQLATGTVIAFCDQDDIWEPGKIEILLAAWNDHTLVYCDSEMIDESNSLLHKKLSSVKNLQTHRSCLPFVIGNCVSGHAMLISKSFLLSIIPFPPEVIYDWWIAYNAACHHGTQFVDRALVNYRQHTRNAIGAVDVKGRMKKTKDDERRLIRKRLALFEAAVINDEEKNIVRAINQSYRDFSPKNNFVRMMLFFKYREALLATKKRSPFRKWLFCVKMFFKII